MLAFISGASRGIGRASAQLLAANGYRIAMLARSESELHTLKSEIEFSGGRAEYRVCDLYSEAETEAAVSELQAALGTPTVLIHNAGWVLKQSFADSTLEDANRIMRLNLLAPIQITRQLLPEMKAAQTGSIICISSISGKLPFPGGPLYAASKHGLSGFANSLFGELREDNIRVATIYPGSVQRDEASEDEHWKLDPKEVAEACLYVASQPQSACVHHLEIRPLNRS